MNTNFVRIVELVLAALIFVGVVAGAIINTFAIDTIGVIPCFEGHSGIIPIAVGSIVILGAGITSLISKIRNKSK